MQKQTLPGRLPVKMLSVAIGLALAPVAALADALTTLDKIEVTGSRIRAADAETRQPVWCLPAPTSPARASTAIADMLQNMTSAGSPATARSDSLASGENVGGYYVDIRNLGAQRTLVLMNGKRLGATTAGLQDLSQIPMAAVERIEILKDGASSIYGSDAIAGVVNMITRKNFDGGEASVSLSASTARATARPAVLAAPWARRASAAADRRAGVLQGRSGVGQGPFVQP